MQASYLIFTHSVVFEWLYSLTRIHNGRENVVQPKFPWKDVHHHMNSVQIVFVAHIFMAVPVTEASRYVHLFNQFVRLIGTSVKHI